MEENGAEVGNNSQTEARGEGVPRERYAYTSNFTNTSDCLITFCRCGRGSIRQPSRLVQPTV